MHGVEKRHKVKIRTVKNNGAFMDVFHAFISPLTCLIASVEFENSINFQSLSRLNISLQNLQHNDSSLNQMFITWKRTESGKKLF